MTTTRSVPRHLVALAGTMTIAACVAALGACSSSDADPSGSATASGTFTTASAPATASATPTATDTATPSPSVSPPATAAGSCDDDQIVPGRLGCIDTNQPASGNPGAAQLAWEPDYCAPGVGRWTYAPSPSTVSVAGHDTPHLWRIDVYDPTLTTPEGVHVGSTEAEVVAAYGGLTPTASATGTKLLVVTNDEGSYVIELADEWGSAPQFTVVNIRIYAAGDDANYPVYGTEDFAAYCPIDF